MLRPESINLHGTDHTREYIPMLFYGPRVRPVALGERATYADEGATVADFLGVKAPAAGESMLPLFWEDKP